MANTGKRLPELVFLNVAFCLAVIFIHVISYPVGALPKGTWMYGACMEFWRLVSVVVPGFILLSGVKAFLPGKAGLPYGRYLLKRAKAILLPYTAWFVLYYICYMIRYDYPPDFMFILKHYWHGSLVYHLYFIPLLVQFDVLMPLWRLLVKKVSAVFAIPLSVLLCFLCSEYLPTAIQTFFPNASFIYNDRLFTSYIAFWVIGIYIGAGYEDFKALLQKNRGFVFGAFAFFAALNGFFSYFAYNELKYIPYMNAIHYGYTLCALLFFFLPALELAKKREAGIVVSRIDRHSYPIYLSHVLLLFAADIAAEHFGILSQSLLLLLHTAFCAVGVFLICLLPKAKKRK